MSRWNAPIRGANDPPTQMEWLHRALSGILDEDEVPHLLQQHQQELLRLEMNCLMALKRKPNLEKKA